MPSSKNPSSQPTGPGSTAPEAGNTERPYLDLDDTGSLAKTVVNTVERLRREGKLPSQKKP